jgi:hypothetical protein
LSPFRLPSQDIRLGQMGGSGWSRRGQAVRHFFLPLWRNPFPFKLGTFSSSLLAG